LTILALPAGSGSIFCSHSHDVVAANEDSLAQDLSFKCEDLLDAAAQGCVGVDGHIWWSAQSHMVIPHQQALV
jgi:hypothetical protein